MTRSVDSPAGPLVGSDRGWRMIARIAAVPIIGLMLFFLVDDALPYLEFSEASYGRFWDRSAWLMVHVVAGSVALITGLFQFWSGLRRRHTSVHRWAGRLYVACIALGGAAALHLAFHTQHWTFGVALFVAGVVWILTTAIAWVAATRRRIEAHREWMLRSYILTSTFVSFRLILEIPWVEALGTEAETSTTVGWLCWVVPLLVYEFLRGWRRSTRG